MNRLIIPSTVLHAVFCQANAERPNECCGVLVGHMRDDAGFVAEAVPLVNELRSPTAYRTEARSLFAAYRLLRTRQLDLIAVFHSHPDTQAIPSRRDREEWTYGDSACAIIGMMHGDPEIRAWQLQGNHAREIDIVIADTANGIVPHS